MSRLGPISYVVTGMSRASARARTTRSELNSPLSANTTSGANASRTAVADASTALAATA